MPFCQFVVGPPGSGKSTYCHGLQQFFALSGRPCAVVNLDPGNEAAPYEATVDVADLVSLPVVMDELVLGPNGGLLYCLEVLEANLEWLREKLAPLGEHTYVLFDLPGQAELSSCHGALRRVVEYVSRELGYRAAVAHLVDCHVCADPHKYLSAVVLSLQAMLHLEMPHVNVLTKMDLFHTHVRDGDDPSDTLREYTSPDAMEHVRAAMHGRADAFSQKHARLTEALCELVEDFSLVSFATLDVENAASVKRLVRAIDKANGYAMASVELERFEQIHALAGRAEPGGAGQEAEDLFLRGGGATAR